jgi:hypothetical protein
LRQQRGATEEHDHPEAEPLHGFDLAVLEMQVADLHHRGGNGHGCGDVDTPDLECREEQEDGKKSISSFMSPEVGVTAWAGSRGLLCEVE